ncbi:hypothetical protein E0H93_26485 [Rhizobium leguminosarum bv. viciae]|uniref:hypothetical protein n=1 Tax=Rhizobium leguminosarum TaxID=384 RepID=UPI00103F4C96|nr:hypothetical protein [Rhizobium leguminosarum]MBY5493240.1 glycosyltransferase family 61 protein [Rhizobium leguminosarum]MBY5526188.1 glycosyltransferase family 61 protein [Rhizobium leguminosarum]TBY30143.1 hypothetical protein E0H55_21940 [Rhizobium leguminosarum bv. viciae]TBY35287.1 hypothetical protein E0H60_24440 [Rhizobium leguminosarum bv. viciae]TCB01006.1 hypothetical protein E0H93_26485 [Rhizobium leguminosarum bv. viciae]
MTVLDRSYETKVSRASNSHFLGDVDACGHPIVLNHGAGLVIPIAMYLNFMASRYPASTCLKHAHVLAVFWDHLQRRQIDYRDANERVLRRFLVNGASRDTKMLALKDDVELRITLERAEFVCAVIERFYRILEDEFLCIPKPSTPRFDQKRALTGAQRTAQRTNPATPSPEDVEVLKDRLLERPNTFAGQNMYGIATLFRSAGLRTCGAVGLTTAAMRQAFVSEPEFLPFLAQIPRELSKLASGIAGSKDVRNLILMALKTMRVRGRMILSVPVFEKGDSSFATVPIDEFSEILDFVFTDRHAFTVRYGRSRPHYRAPDFVFLSSKTGNGFEEKSISNLFSETMRLLGIPGTAHRIRATSIEDHLKNLYYLHRGMHGIAWQPGNILEWSRMYARHKSTGPLVHYINRIINIEEVLGYLPVLFDDTDLAACARALASIPPERKQDAVDGMLALMGELDLVPLEEPFAC